MTQVFQTLGTAIGALVEEKNKAYGDSFAKSGEVLRQLYPNGIRTEQYDDALAIIRIVDKLFRIATAKDAFGESPFRDIAGYGILGAARSERGGADAFMAQAAHGGPGDQSARCGLWDVGTRSGCDHPLGHSGAHSFIGVNKFATGPCATIGKLGPCTLAKGHTGGCIFCSSRVEPICGETVSTAYGQSVCKLPYGHAEHHVFGASEVPSESAP